tara:strand:+ start:63 stop:365 length:303 start_codon:yes stop_codon:yes gene_type:complete
MFFEESEKKTSFIITFIGLALIFWWIFSFLYGDTAAEWGCKYQVGSYVYLSDTCVDDNRIKMEDDYSFLLKFLSGIGYFLIICGILTWIKYKVFPDEDDD